MRGIEEIKTGRIVDLSHRLYPEKEEYRLKVETFPATDVAKNLEVTPGTWYIMQNISMSSHVGTHLEAPFHHKKDGLDASALPLERLMGPGILLDFSKKEDNEPITLEELAHAGEIRPGDIVFIRTGRSKFYRTRRSHDRPYLTLEAVRFLVEKKVSVVGIDATGIGKKKVKDQPDHQLLFDNGIPLIECLANLEALERERFFVIILPLPIVGADSSPVRVVAIE